MSDIVSALASRRSYKDPFPKEKTLSILREMQKGKLDLAVCDYVCHNYDEIMSQAEKARGAVIEKYQSMVRQYHLLGAAQKTAQ